MFQGIILGLALLATTICSTGCDVKKTPVNIVEMEKLTTLKAIEDDKIYKISDHETFSGEAFKITNSEEYMKNPTGKMTYEATVLPISEDTYKNITVKLYDTYGKVVDIEEVVFDKYVTRFKTGAVVPKYISMETSHDDFIAQGEEFLMVKP